MSLMIGIAGGTGSGKTTVARRLFEGLEGDGVALIEYDHYYRDRSDTPPAARDDLNFDHPDALDTALLVEHLGELRRGRAVEVPSYDFKTHTRRTQTTTLEPHPVVIVEGILTFVSQPLRELFDLKIFVDTDADVRLMRRLQRDVAERGRSIESVFEQYTSTVRPMHLQFVEPSKRYADIIIPEGAHNDVALDLVLSKARSALVAATMHAGT